MAVAGRAVGAVTHLRRPFWVRRALFLAPLSAGQPASHVPLAERECQTFGKVARSAVNLSRPCLAGVDLECFFTL